MSTSILYGENLYVPVAVGVSTLTLFIYTRQTSVSSIVKTEHTLAGIVQIVHCFFERMWIHACINGDKSTHTHTKKKRKKKWKKTSTDH